MATDATTTARPLCWYVTSRHDHAYTNIHSDITSSEIITIKVGSDAKEYRVPQALLAHYSEYFRGAFRSGMEESRTRIFTFKDIDPITFQVFSDWLHKQRLPPHDEWET